MGLISLASEDGKLLSYDAIGELIPILYLINKRAKSKDVILYKFHWNQHPHFNYIWNIINLFRLYKDIGIDIGAGYLYKQLYEKSDGTFVHIPNCHVLYPQQNRLGRVMREAVNRKNGRCGNDKRLLRSGGDHACGRV